MSHRRHHGHAIKRLREIRGLKQEALALEMGEDWSQRRISLLEGKEEIEEKLLEQVAAALGIAVEGIENFCETTLLQTLTSKTTGTGEEPEIGLHSTGILLLENLLEEIKENKRLYERLLQSEKEKTALLRQFFIPATASGDDAKVEIPGP